MWSLMVILFLIGIGSVKESMRNGIPHEGMYTKQELKELVAYCAAPVSYTHLDVYKRQAQQL